MLDDDNKFDVISECRIESARRVHLAKFESPESDAEPQKKESESPADRGDV